MYESRMFTPGPAHVPLAVRLASIGVSGHHRAPGYRGLHARLVEGLRRMFGTTGDVMVLSGSGSTAMEAVVHNVVSHGDAVLVLDAGKYGRRWAELAATYGAEVATYAVEAGATFELSAFEQALAASRPRHVFLTHCETSTGVTHDVASFARVANAAGATVIVDAMATIGVEPFAMDEWQVDIAVTASHKGLMSPPGAAFIAVNPRGWQRIRRDAGYSTMSLLSMKANGDKLTTPNTPPLSVLFAVAAALDIIEDETLPAVWRRHDAAARACRAGVAALGLPLFAQGRPAAGVTAIAIPAHLDFGGLVDEMELRFRMRIAGGQGDLAGRILRVGHMGAVTGFDLLPAFAALEIVATERGLVAAPGVAVAAVAASLRHDTTTTRDRRDQHVDLVTQAVNSNFPIEEPV